MTDVRLRQGLHGALFVEANVSRLPFRWGGVWGPGENFPWWSCISGPSPWCPRVFSIPTISCFFFSLSLPPPFPLTLFLLLWIICWCPLNKFMCWSCSPQVVVFGGGFGEVIGFGRSQGVEPQWWHWCPYTVMKRAELFLGLVRIRWEGGCLQARKWVLPRTQPHRLLASRTVRNKLCCLSLVVYGILLWQPEKAKHFPSQVYFCEQILLITLYPKCLKNYS